MNQVNQHDLGESIRVSREERGWTQRYLAEKVGISRSLLSKVEKGTRQLSEEKLNLILDSLQEELVPVNRVLIDYLTIHFFSNQYLKLIEAIIGMPIERFEELDYAPKGYIGQYVWNQVITIRYSIDDTVKGTVMEFSGQGCKHLAMRLKTAKSNWQEFFRKVLAYQGNFTRIDFTLDDFVGSLSIPELKRKVTLGHVWTTFQVSESHGGTDITNNESNGETLYLGSKKSQCRFCFYQKDYEQRKRRGIPLEEAEVKNRFELRYRKEKAQSLAKIISRTHDLTKLFFELLNGAICFYDRDPNDPGAKVDKKWAAFIGNHGAITISLETIPQSFEKSMNWLIHGVSPSLAFIAQVDQTFHSSLLSLIIEQGEMNPRQIKLLQNMKADPEYYQEEVEYYERKLQSISNEKTSY
ncbi:replication initiation protein [Enterococcus thailandicus]|uniref:Replication initiation protein n=4 Tax=Enterococcus TaxID=1350 RepID=A0A510WAF3_ENTTH|nr:MULTISPECIES: replication initiation factor domain-containing protein [Enterococcus]EFF20302.1 putative transcriptional regulator [Enterococcus faecium E1071]MDK4351523.1 replication initiation factor domain-containing protein [Enterococcus thailandicus]MDT2733725.1 replication initiation factor domain-containing protein [Enterococcus thailandicus]BCA86308.1 replication initiation protein [Enterococcus saigonensis]GEK35897.1 replication initiation protein [Enterococcus thailandicus]